MNADRKPRNEREAHAALFLARNARRSARPHVTRRRPPLLARIDAWLKRHLFVCVAVLGFTGIALALTTAEAGPALALAQILGVK